MDIRKWYEEVVVGNKYDLNRANAHTMSIFQSEPKAKEMPEIEAQFVRENHAGCCLHYSMYLIYLLHNAGIRCYLTTTPEEDGANHASVLYFDEEGEKHIADPVKDVQDGTLNENMAIDYDEFVENAIRHEISHYDLYGEYGEEEFFKSFFVNRKLDLTSI